MTSLADIDRIEDENVLESLITQTEDLNIRRQIRKRQKEIREKRQAAYEASKTTAKKENATEMRLRMAAEEKQRKMKEFENKAKEKKDSSEDVVLQRQQQADEEKQRKMEQFKEMSKGQSSLYNAGVTDVLKDKEGFKETPANKTPAPKTSSAAPGFLGGGISYVSKPGSGASGDAGNKVVRNPSGVKEMLLEWCKKQCEGYEHVNITNFSSSWSDGMAFCALIHHFCPNAFDYSKLNPKNRRGNFTLAFKVAEKEADIPALLDVEDMVRMKNPDWKCVFTYVQGFYRRFGMQKA